MSTTTPIKRYTPNERRINGDGLVRRANGVPYNPLTGEDLTPEEIMRVKRGEPLIPDEPAPCWTADTWTMAQTDDDVMTLAKPEASRLTPPDYVLRPLLPRKTVTVLAADSGTGKSTLCAHLEALASRGELDEGRPLKVLVITTEDSADDLAAQYVAENADVENIRLLRLESNTLTTSTGERALKTFGAKDLPRIIKAAYAVKPDIIRFDPLHRFAAGDWNNAKSTEFVDELTVMAQSLNCVVLGVLHTKKGADVAKEAITGTGQWVAKARSAAVMAAPDDDKNHVVLQQIKSNRSATQNFEIEFATKEIEYCDGSVGEVRYVASMAPTTRTADDVFAQNLNDRAAFVDRDELSEIARWVYDTIAQRGGHMFSTDLFDLAHNCPAKWSAAQVRRSFKAAGVGQTKQKQRRPRAIVYLFDHCTADEAQFWGTIPDQTGGTENDRRDI